MHADLLLEIGKVRYNGIVSRAGERSAPVTAKTAGLSSRYQINDLP
jgi:hypothetical protein